VIFKVVLLKMCGGWGRRKLRESILGRSASAELPPAARKFMEFVALIHEHFKPRMERVPVFSDAALKRLTMPVLAIVGGKDVMLDSAETKRRLEACVPHAEIRCLPEGGHAIKGQSAAIVEFLRGAKSFTATL